MHALVVIGQGVLGFATGIFVYLWMPVSYFGSVLWMERQRRWRDVPASRFQTIGFWIAFGGAGLIWLIWRYVLPDWWIEATPLLSADR